MTTRPVAVAPSYAPSRSSGASIPYRHDRLPAASPHGTHVSQQRPSQAQAQAQQSQQTASEIHEYCCLFTHDLHQKKKRWKDGWVKHHVFNNRLMVYDLERNHISSCFLQTGDETVAEGWEGRVDNVIVEIGELKRKELQDLSKIFAKPQRNQANQIQPGTASVSGPELASSAVQMSMAPPQSRLSVKSAGSDSLKAVLARAKAKEDRKSWLKTPLVGFDLPADSEPSPAAQRAKRRKLEATPQKRTHDDVYTVTPAPAGRVRGKESNPKVQDHGKTSATRAQKAPGSKVPPSGAQKATARQPVKTPIEAPPHSSLVTISSDEDDSLFFPQAPRTYTVLPPGSDVTSAANTLITTSSTTRKKGLLCAPQTSRPGLSSTSNPSEQEAEPPPKTRQRLKFNPIPDPLCSDSDEPAFETLASVEQRPERKGVKKPPKVVATPPPEITDSQMMDLSFTPYVPSTGKPKAKPPPKTGPWSAEAFFLFSKRELKNVPDCRERLEALEKARAES